MEHKVLSVIRFPGQGHMYTHGKSGKQERTRPPPNVQWIRFLNFFVM